MDVYTSITFNYLPKARLLANSLKRFHKDWNFHLVISDRFSPEHNYGSEPNWPDEPFDDVIWVEQLPIDDLTGWIFKHTVVEICTAVKGPVAEYLQKQGADKIIYLDPDIAVFNDLDPLNRLLDTHPVLLTPHQLTIQENERAIVDNEICALKYGVFNLGFMAANNSPEGSRFVDWWNNRLLNYCYADIPNGLFTDQKWCDLAPAFFPGLHIIRDPGYNVASWNLSERELSVSRDGTILVNDQPLRFYHFTGYDSGAGHIMTQIYAEGNHVVNEIWAWYKRQLDMYGQEAADSMRWYFDYFDNGEKIDGEMRRLYRQRKDLQQAFPDPFSTESNGGYYAWYRNKVD